MPHPDVARPAVSRARQRQGRHGRGHGDRDPRARKARRLLESDAHQCQRSGGHRPGRAGDRHPRRSLRPGSVRPQGQHLRREPRRLERATAGARQAARRDHGRPRRARRRRHPRDGQRRPRADHDRRRLPRRVLEQGVHRPSRCATTSRCDPAAPWRSRSARTIPKLRDAVNTWAKKHGKGDAFRNVRRASLSRQRQVREERRRPSPSAGSSRRSSSCSRSTATSTTSTTC